MMRWRPWPPIPSRKFQAKLNLYRLEGLCASAEKPLEIQDFSQLAVEIKWKGSKGNGLSYLRRSVRRNYTKEERLREGGEVEWNEEFQSVCTFSGYNKEGLFQPWEVVFTVFNGLNHGPINKVPAVATASLNLAEFASVNEQKELEIRIPLSVHGDNIDCSPSLCLSVTIWELKTTQEPSKMVKRSVAPLPLSPRSADGSSIERDEGSTLKAGLRKVKELTRRATKTRREEESSDGRSSVRSEDAEFSFDTESLDTSEVESEEEVKEEYRFRKSVSYGSLAYANHAGASFYWNTAKSEDENLIYYSHRRTDEGLTASELDPSLQQISLKRSILPWKRRKLSFKSPKAKGEPLLKKDCGEEGGDDIDFDRRQLSSSDESTFGWEKSEDSTANRSSVSEFGDDTFTVGSWENTVVISRDGHVKLQTQVFFASIDQRSERAAGESACTALVAVIADWFQSNHDEMPIKSQLDSLIREGSLEWRNLCEIETYRDRFPDKHFDLDTVIEAKIRPLCVVPENSFVGFFHPEGLEEEEVEGFDFLHGAMSFDSIWDEISRFRLENPRNGDDPFVYIVSWNDHFFLLKVEHDAYYIIDTLGERLFEGCNQAYVLKFDKDTVIQSIPEEKTTKSSDEDSVVENGKSDIPKEDSSGGKEINISNDLGTSEEEESVVCRGKECCKEYIKSFLAAIPIRELQVDLKKGLMASTPIHHRLQIEFHYTRYLQPEFQFSLTEGTSDGLAIPTLAV